MGAAPLEEGERPPGEEHRRKNQGDRKNCRIGGQRTERAGRCVRAVRMLVRLFAVVMVARRSDGERRAVIRAGTGDDGQAAAFERRHIAGRAKQAERKKQPEQKRGETARRSRTCPH